MRKENKITNGEKKKKKSWPKANKKNEKMEKQIFINNRVNEIANR